MILKNLGMASFTCISCRVLFQSADLQRDHYRTDWHRYNLKRKLVELSPITEDDFKLKIEFQTKRKEDLVNAGKSTTVCKICNKSFSSAKAYDNHIKSNKHKQEEIKFSKDDNGNGKKGSTKEYSKKKTTIIKLKPGYMPPLEDSGVNNDDSDEWEDVGEEEVEEGDIESDEEESEAIPQACCLFCSRENPSVADNLRHMSKAHSFFIPDLDYVTDLEAFLIYLGAKVGDGKICLFCNNHSKQFRLLSACQSHMLDKGHCMLDYEGDAILEYADFYDFSSSYPDHSEGTDVDSELKHIPTMDFDEQTMELILPSGSRAGHRALRKYYNQNLAAEAVQKKNRAMITGVNTHYKALGLHGASLALATRKKIEARKMENVDRSFNRMTLGVKANKLQKHFRKQYAYCG